MKENTLRVGLDYAAPIPLHTDILSGKFEGFEVDLVNQIAEELGLKLQHSVALWKEIINDLVKADTKSIRYRRQRFFVKKNNFDAIKQSLVEIVQYWSKSKTPE